MLAYKCDLCKKEKEVKEIVTIRHCFDGIELCKKCAEPIVKFLKKHKLIKEEKK